MKGPSSSLPHPLFSQCEAHGPPIGVGREKNKQETIVFHLSGGFQKCIVYGQFMVLWQQNLNCPSFLPFQCTVRLGLGERGLGTVWLLVCLFVSRKSCRYLHKNNHHMKEPHHFHQRCLALDLFSHIVYITDLFMVYQTLSNVTSDHQPKIPNNLNYLVPDWLSA